MANSSGKSGVQKSISRFLSTQTINAKIIVGFTLPVGLMILVSMLSYQDTLSQQRSSRLVNDTQAVISQAHRLSNLILEMASIEEQFLILGTEATLEPFQEMQNQWVKQLDLLKKSVANSPEKLEQLDKIAAQTKLWLETIAQPEIALR